MADSMAAKASAEYFQTLGNSGSSYADDKVCVVGIFGKGSSGHRSKASHANAAVEKDVFQKKKVGSLPCDIEVHHDVEQRIIYLHLVSVYDASRLAQLCEHIHSQLSNTESHRYWKTQEYYHACALLFMFSVCHVMVLVHPSQTLDLSYVRLFRILAATRHQLLTPISHQLSSIDGIPEIWRQTGRPCIPRLICSFSQPVSVFLGIEMVAPENLNVLFPRLSFTVLRVSFSSMDLTVKNLSDSKDTYASKAKGKLQTTSPRKKLQRSLEDQIYSIMRKSRLLGSLSSSSLFTVSSGHAFVHVQPNTASCDPIGVMLHKLVKPALSTQWAESSSILKNSSFMKHRLSAPHNTVECDLADSEQELLFRDYLKQHIDHLMTGDAGRDGVAEGRRGTHVEVPTCRLWAQVCHVLYDLFLGSASEGVSTLTALASQLDLDSKFSEGRCRKVLPLATSAYLETLPSHYTQSVHISQLTQALRVFALHARGPAFDHYAAQLQEECNKTELDSTRSFYYYLSSMYRYQVWLNGRQLCEERSLTGRHCVYPYHTVSDDVGLPGAEEKEHTTGVPCKPHSSRITSVSACNCGRLQEQREDPFDLKTANYGFYMAQELKCCSYLGHLVFPCHPSFLLPRAAEPAIKETHEAEEPPLLEMAVETTSPGTSEPTHVTEAASSEDEHVHEESATDHEATTPQASVAGIIPIPDKVAASMGSGKVVAGSHGNSVSSSHAYSLSGFQSTLDMTSHDSHELRSVTSAVLTGEVNTVGSEEILSTHEPHVYTSDTAVASPWQRQEKIQGVLKSMLTSDSPPGIFPRVPSWSLCKLGTATLYQASKGLDQPGFFPGSNFLLAWDIPVLNDGQTELLSQFDGQAKHFGVKSSGGEAWPAPNELPSPTVSTTVLPLHQAVSFSHKQCSDYKTSQLPLLFPQGPSKPGAGTGTSRSRGRGQREGGSSVRAYIGDEYECPRGHRFICSGPDKMVKATSSGHVKETAQKLVAMDMPLYFPCPCRSSKPLMAQLMRVFVVTPDSPLLVTLKPRIQPATSPCPVFLPGVSSGITLPPASFCVLRFPFVYVTENGPILPPADSQPLLSCRVLKGMFSVMGKAASFDHSGSAEVKT